ncbi:aromatic-ring-hydroxylating dioxygenase subunit beta [Maritimibacter sp. UBA3975]|uniref:aromatic-ring-hydroxylating dioxygenase subunit beta n=1 Tax=Maritimibacter sp. UBA3975 TaxID=1946833 RepID=UPI000C09A9DE|nr:aromatic-ring-hydroxylating dioxygenase subunit beta [Maritimibacter sp. UBA3975]MAM62232.1 benzene 1,2-dioxygenase [Maritimibacter sp.]|tara:strand:- start:19356 stop:19889 length:534 start_codon:yes stop_codon:yes gene_type:complete
MAEDHEESVDMATHFAISQFLYREAELLDDRDFRGWMTCFSEDVHYWMPHRTNRPPRERAREVSAANELAIYDEFHQDLKARVAKIETGKAWAEEPPSRTRHFVSNVRVTRKDADFRVRSNILVIQCRNDLDEHLFVGERFDLLRSDPEGSGGFRIAERKIVLDQATLRAPSISIFF